MFDLDAMASQPDAESKGSRMVELAMWSRSRCMIIPD